MGKTFKGFLLLLTFGIASTLMYYYIFEYTDAVNRYVKGPRIIAPTGTLKAAKRHRVNKFPHLLLRQARNKTNSYDFTEEALISNGEHGAETDKSLLSQKQKIDNGNWRNGDLKSMEGHGQEYGKPPRKDGSETKNVSLTGGKMKSAEGYVKESDKPLQSAVPDENNRTDSDRFTTGNSTVEDKHLKEGNKLLSMPVQKENSNFDGGTVNGGSSKLTGEKVEQSNKSAASPVQIDKDKVANAEQVKVAAGSKDDGGKEARENPKIISGSQNKPTSPILHSAGIGELSKGEQKSAKEGESDKHASTPDQADKLTDTGKMTEGDPKLTEESRKDGKRPIQPFAQGARNEEGSEKWTKEDGKPPESQVQGDRSKVDDSKKWNGGEQKSDPENRKENKKPLFPSVSNKNNMADTGKQTKEGPKPGAGHWRQVNKPLPWQAQADKNKGAGGETPKSIAEYGKQLIKPLLSLVNKSKNKTGNGQMTGKGPKTASGNGKENNKPAWSPGQGDGNQAGGGKWTGGDFKRSVKDEIGSNKTVEGEKKQVDGGKSNWGGKNEKSKPAWPGPAQGDKGKAGGGNVKEGGPKAAKGDSKLKENEKPASFPSQRDKATAAGGKLAQGDSKSMNESGKQNNKPSSPAGQTGTDKAGSDNTEAEGYVKEKLKPLQSPAQKEKNDVASSNWTNKEAELVEKDKEGWRKDNKTSPVPKQKTEAGGGGPNVNKGDQNSVSGDNKLVSGGNPLIQHNFKLILNEPMACKNANGSEKAVFLLVLVVTTHGAFDTRQTIRETWGHPKELMGKAIVTLFMLGKSVNDTLDKLLQRESDEHHDILQEDFIDNYKNLTLKTMFGMKWVKEYCPQASYVLKTDHDMYINQENLLELLTLPTTPKKRFMTGHVFKTMKPIRNSIKKNYMPEEIYGGPVYPPYCAGAAYVMSGDMPALVFNMSVQSTRYNHIEDVLVGICLQKLGIQPTPHDGFWHNAMPFVPYSFCGYRNVITMHGATKENMVSIWKSQHSNHQNEKCPK